MPKFDISEYQKQRPMVQMAPLIDIVFLTLIFFMTISVLNQMESELNINVPKATMATEATRSAGKMIINITADGRYVVNQRELSRAGLEEMLKDVSELFPNQQVIIRADENTYHKHVVEVLDTCMRANIWDVSFSTIQDQK
jgi:biopolymer transport protein ExbD